MLPLPVLGNQRTEHQDDDSAESLLSDSGQSSPGVDKTSPVKQCGLQSSEGFGRKLRGKQVASVANKSALSGCVRGALLGQPLGKTNSGRFQKPKQFKRWHSLRLQDIVSGDSL